MASDSGPMISAQAGGHEVANICTILGQWRNDDRSGWVNSRFRKSETKCLIDFVVHEGRLKKAFATVSNVYKPCAVEGLSPCFTPGRTASGQGPSPYSRFPRVARPPLIPPFLALTHSSPPSISPRKPEEADLSVPSYPFSVQGTQFRLMWALPCFLERKHCMAEVLKQTTNMPQGENTQQFTSDIMSSHHNIADRPSPSWYHKEKTYIDGNNRQERSCGPLPANANLGLPSCSPILEAIIWPVCAFPMLQMSNRDSGIGHDPATVKSLLICGATGSTDDPLARVVICTDLAR
ncbi:uncharacterized protein EI90DRAFT_3015957 [Cantharellus anzutake]|uniref:uncharacterized protein n=1 Tax=Cantharellus anzutake TaxID=1750568 RepID=UPI0019041577|nr:uncharacterized protein EI90DRAFT_3015957 [Cantharellus anzutake]KAF8332369.1 hypothetical protein EI90DRAFT_3015957 [Cantharellus anzutake]